jgi:hypothetical protein
VAVSEIDFGMKIKATTKRILLAWYVDLLFANVLFFLIAHFLKAELRFGDHGRYIPAVVYAIAARFFPRVSLGQRFLSIDQDGFVDPLVKKHESFWLMALATVLLLDGTKQLVRWANFSSWPFLGLQPIGASQIVISIILGSASIIASYLVFKLDRRGYWLTILLLALWQLNILLSWSLMNSIMAQRVVERRALQHVPVRAGEVEFMQLVMNPGLLVVGCLLLILVFWQRYRFFDRGS